MSENTHSRDDENSPAALPASSNQNLILGIVMGAVVLLLVLLMVSMRQGGMGGGVSGGDLAQAERERNAALAEYELARVGSGVSALSAEVLKDKIQADTEALASMVDDMQAQMTRLQAAEESSRVLSRQVASMQQEVDAGRGARSQLEDLQGRLRSAQDTIVRLQDSLNNAPDPGVALELQQARVTIQQLRDELERMRAQRAGMVDGARVDSLRKLNDQLQGDNARMRRELQRLRAELDRKSLFVTRDNLDPRAAALFAELVGLEGKNVDALQLEYSRVNSDLNAKVLDRVQFATGSSEIDLKREDVLKNGVAASPAGSFFLVVGYASKTGGAVDNEKLSSDRATRVASVVNVLKQQGQKVQAVYLGETDRFGDTAAPNQACELWEIRP